MGLPPPCSQHWRDNATTLAIPGTVLEIVQLAQYGSRKTATALLRAMLATREAWGYAQLGEAQSFARAVGLAEEYFSDGLSDGDPRAVHGFDAAELAGTIGGRYRDLARHEPRWARKAHDRTHLITADPKYACELVHQAIPLGRPWVNGRVGTKLREFHQEASQYAGIPVVRDTRDLIQEMTSSNGWLKG